MAYYPFYEHPELLVFCCTHVLDEIQSINVVYHHYTDGSWVFLCGKEHSDADAVITGIMEVVHLDKSVARLCDLPVGCFAERMENGFWRFGRIADEPCYPHTLKALEELEEKEQKLMEQNHESSGHIESH